MQNYFVAFELNQCEVFFRTCKYGSPIYIGNQIGFFISSCSRIRIFAVKRGAEMKCLMRDITKRRPILFVVKMCIK
jgi:hypothetical protein